MTAESPFPKYTSQIINLASRNSGATRPKVVGQMSDLIIESGARDLDSWRRFYERSNPGSSQIAVDKIEEMIRRLREAIELIDRDLVNRWVDELLIKKTFYGFRAQDAILKELAERMDLPLITASAEDESMGIDGYLGGRPISVKPLSYKNERQKGGLCEEEIRCPIIYYKKTKKGIRVDVSDF